MLQPTKSNHNRGPVSITQEIVDVLHRIRDTQMSLRLEIGSDWNKSGFVLTDEFGDPLDPGRITKAFTKMMKEMGTQGLGLHDLPHTHASIMLHEDVHPKVVSERLGHSSINITMDTYSHVILRVQEDAAERFSNALNASRQGCE